MRAVGIEDLDQHAGRLHARQQRQVARRLGVAGAVEHAAGLRHQREDVAGLRQVARRGVRAHRGADGVGAVVGGDAGGDAFGRLDRLTVKLVRCGEVLSRTIGGRPSWRQRSRVSDRHTRPRACVTMKLMSCRPHQFGGHDQVAFVLAVLVVDDHDHAAGADFFQQFGDGWRSSCVLRAPAKHRRRA